MNILWEIVLVNFELYIVIDLGGGVSYGWRVGFLKEYQCVVNIKGVDVGQIRIINVFYDSEMFGVSFSFGKTFFTYKQINLDFNILNYFFRDSVLLYLIKICWGYFLIFQMWVW